MATLYREVMIEAPADEVWSAARDVGALHTRLVPGFVTDTRLEGGTRLVSFFNGMVARETIISVDDERRRLAYGVMGGRAAHFNGSLQVFPSGDASRVVWIIDLLPDDLAGAIGEMQARGIEAMKRALEGSASEIS